MAVQVQDSPVERVRLYGVTDTWSAAASVVRALLFGAMVERARPVVQHYLSDLYHDAVWVSEHVVGATEFLWMVRENGTDLGELAQVQERISSREPRVLYHVALTEERGTWWATFTTLVAVTSDGQVVPPPPVCEHDVPMSVRCWRCVNEASR